MPRLRFPLILRILPAFLALGGAAFGAETSYPGPGMRQTVLRMTEFFDTTLPGVLQEQNLTLHFTPKFSDLRDQEYIRFPFELRYGATSRLELSGGLTPFSPNPFNGGREHRWGP